MKKLYLVSIVVLLTGCSLLAPSFDNNEYEQFVKLNSEAVFLKAQCGTTDMSTGLTAMKYNTGNLLTYATYLPNNEEITSMAKIIDNDVQELIDRGDNMSKTYCELKFDQIMIKLDEALDSVGNLN